MATKKPEVGKTVKYLGAQPGKTPSNFCAPIGTELRITSVGNNCGLKTYNVTAPCIGSGFVYAYECSSLIQTKEEIEKDIARMEEEIKELKSKVAFIEKFGLESYDEDEFKAYSVLETIGIDDIQKARAICKILAK